MVDGRLSEGMLQCLHHGVMSYWLTLLAIDSKVPGIPPKDDPL